MSEREDSPIINIRHNELRKSRKATDDIIVDVEAMINYGCASGEHMRCLALARTKLQEAKMWMGQAMGQLPDNDKYFPQGVRDLSDKR